MEKYSRKFFWLCVDLFSINIAFALSILLRFGMDCRGAFYQYRIVFLYLSLFYLIFAVIFKLHSRVWEYINIYDLFLIAKTVTCIVVALILYFNIGKGIYFPWTVKALTWFISVSLIGGSKLVWRLSWEKRVPFKRREERILIVGAGDAGNIISQEIEKRKDLGLLVGFVDDDISKIGRFIQGKKVLGSIDEINEIINKEKVGMIVIAIPSIKGSGIRRIINKINRKEIKTRIVPGLYELLDNNISVSKIRNIKVEDLLNREAINLDIEKISEYIKGKRIMVTGGAGSIGEEISRQICKYSPGELMILDHNENGLFYAERKIKKECCGVNLRVMVADIRDRKKMENVFKNLKPEVVFHAAAHKHVPLMEYHPDEAVSNNIIGTKYLVELADEYGVNSFVMISTDKAINPTSVMGASKQVAEMVVKMYGKKSKTNFVAVRFGNVLASNASVINIFKKQIAEGGPVTVTDGEMKRYFMTISEASQLVIQAGGLGIKEAVFVLDMGEPVKVLDLARNLIHLSGFVPDEDIKIEFIGLRPGEKLFEELLTKKERSRILGDTKHEKIFIAQTEDVDGEKLEKDIDELEVLVGEMDVDGIVRKLQEVVPNYRPNRGMMEKK
jgi:FlaA1/EpsC-like NDP-sugar epimerase